MLLHPRWCWCSNQPRISPRRKRSEDLYQRVPWVRLSSRGTCRRFVGYRPPVKQMAINQNDPCVFFWFLIDHLPPTWGPNSWQRLRCGRTSVCDTVVFQREEKGKVGKKKKTKTRTTSRWVDWIQRMRSDYRIGIALLFEEGRELDQPQLVGGNGPSFPWRRWSWRGKTGRRGHRCRRCRRRGRRCVVVGCGGRRQKGHLAAAAAPGRARSTIRRAVPRFIVGRRTGANCVVWLCKRLDTVRERLHKIPKKKKK